MDIAVKYEFLFIDDYSQDIFDAYVASVQNTDDYNNGLQQAVQDLILHIKENILQFVPNINIFSHLLEYQNDTFKVSIKKSDFSYPK